MSVSPSEAPRLANVMLDGSCTQLAPIVWDEETETDMGEQWDVDVTQSVDGTAINQPVQFATDYDGTFHYPVQIVGSSEATVPAAGDTVDIDVWCHEWTESGTGGRSFHLSTDVTVNDATTCPDALPASTGELGDDDAAAVFHDYTYEGTYSGDGWQPGGDVLVCYYSNPQYDDQPAQRFGGDVADQAGAVSIRTIGEAVTPYDPTQDGDLSGADGTVDDGTVDDGTDDGGDGEALRPAAVAQPTDDNADSGDVSGEGDSSDLTVYTLAVLGTAADGSPRVLTKDVTPTAVAASAEDVPVTNPVSAKAAPVLAYSGANSDRLIGGGIAMLVLGVFLLLVTRRWDEADQS